MEFTNIGVVHLSLVILSCFLSTESRILSTSNKEISFIPHGLNDTGKASLACGSQSSGIYSFTVESQSPLGTINLLYVQHNGNRKIPYATTVLQNSLNHQQNVDRKDNFRIHPCSALSGKQTACSATYKMTAAQQTLTGRTAFDRGHLTLVNPFRFHESAVDHTFYCVNIAPQDPYTNQGPWATVEDRVHQMLKDKAGYVMTGVCDRDSTDGPTLDGWRVPECFWKLVCYKDAGVVRVVGYIGDNKLFHKDDAAAKAQRTADTTKVRSQSEILAKMNSASFIQAGWRGADSYLLENRRETNAPSPTACINALTAPPETLNQWAII